MAIARFKDLCLDVHETSDRMGRFWAEATGLTYEPGGHVSTLRGDRPEQRIWLNQVPEAPTVKNRVHLDVRVPSVEAMLEAGARVVDGYPSHGWQVMADPDGNEFCAFATDDPPGYRLFEVIVDSADAVAVARWWADVFGARLDGDPERGWQWIEQVPGMPFDSIDFIPVPEAKIVRNRVHWDITVASPGDVDELVRRGATRLPGYPTEEWTVLADPEGNEFCVFVNDEG